MKKRSMILALASMLGISAAATAVSGFAWFTTQRTATISQSTYKVGASQGSLKIEAVDDTDINCESTIGGSVCGVEVDDEHELADVSSVDGETFRKAILNSTGTAVTDIQDEEAPDPYNGTWMSKVNENQMVCVSWSMELSNENPGSPVDVYLSKTGALFEANAAAVTAETETLSVKGDGATKAFKLAYKAIEVTSITLNGESTSAYSIADDKQTINFTTAPADKAVIAVTYKADFSEFYRLAIIDDTTSNLVFLYTDANHLKGIQAGDTKDDGFDGTANLTAANDAKKGALRAITSAADADATEIHAGNQMLVSGLASTNHTLKFVVWCEGTATPEKPVMANSVTTSMNLVAVTPAA